MHSVPEAVRPARASQYGQPPGSLDRGVREGWRGHRHSDGRVEIGSKEGPKQLKRYVEDLEEMPGVSSERLDYITRGYDPKGLDEVLSGLSDNAGFE